MPATSDDVDALIANHATSGFTGGTPLLDAGIESLSLLRMVAEVVPDDGDQEIDATRLAELRTIDDLRAWLTDLVGGTC